MLLNRILIFVLGCLLLVAEATLAKPSQQLQALQQNGKLRIKAWIEPQENIIARQQVNLQIEVATDRWFSSGTRIRHFEIADAIVLQRDNFAVNSTLREGDKTWTVQLWTLVIYPQRGGVFEIPEIALELSIAGEDSQAIVGEVLTRSFGFLATIPEMLQQKADWVATTRFAVSERFNKSFEELQPGDALIRTITVTADNLPAMMLPGLASPAVSGVSVYKQPAQLTDSANRGDYFAERIEEVTYVFEQAGDFELPGQGFYWWNLQSQSMQSLQLEAVPLRVTGEATASKLGINSGPVGTSERNQDMQAVMKTVITTLAILGLLVLAVLKRRQTVEAGAVGKQTKMTENTLRIGFARACKQRDFEQALRLLYRWQDQYGGDSFGVSLRAQIELSGRAELLKAFNDVMHRMYGINDYNDVDLEQFADDYFKAAIHSQARSGYLPGLAVDLRLN